MALTVTAHAAEPASTWTVGFQDRVPREGLLTTVRTEVTNPVPTPEKIDVLVRAGPRARSKTTGEDVFASEPNRFVRRLTLGPLETRTISIPIISGPRDLVEVTAVDHAGNPLLGPFRKRLAPVGNLVVILCVETTICQLAQSAIAFSGTDEDRDLKRKELTFEVLKQLPPEWWRYHGAMAVLVARSLSHSDIQERRALEQYARHGGRLILVEDLLNSQAFLKAYRTESPVALAQPLGKGLLYRIPDFESPRLARLFGGLRLDQMIERERQPRLGLRPTALSWARHRLARAFTFPGLAWLMAWLVFYILVVGVANFTLLTKLGRREYAWLTVPGLSIIFALATYAVTDAQRPDAFQVDQIGIYWMDDSSPIATADVDLRIASPSRTRTQLSVRDSAVISGPPRDFSVARAFLMGNAEGTYGRPWDIEVGNPLKIDLFLLQWSFRDIELKASRELAGRLRLTRDGFLANETGLHFKEALYIEPQAVHSLGAFPPGEKRDLAAALVEPVEQHTGRPYDYPRIFEPRRDEPFTGRFEADQDPEVWTRHLQEWSELSTRPFALIELIRGWPKENGAAFDSRSALFLGLAEGKTLEAKISAASASRRHYVITVVSFAKTS